MITYLYYVRPFKSKLQIYMEIINECFILTAVYFLVIFSEFVPNAKVRYNMGWGLISILSLQLLINIGVIVVNLILIIKKSC